MSTIGRLTVESFLAALAERSPAPGGGAVAGVVGGMGCALASMVVAYSLGRKSLAEHEPELRRAADSLEASRSTFLDLSDRDASAYEALNAAMKTPRDDPDRAARLCEAARGAMDPPWRALKLAIETVRVLDSLIGKTNPNLASDLAIASDLMGSCARAAAWNVAVNLDLLDDPGLGEHRRRELSEALNEVERLGSRVRTACSGAGR